MSIGLVFLCFGLLILAPEGYSATAWQKQKMKPLSPMVDRPDAMPELSNVPQKYTPSGINYDLTCEDILPAVGTIIQHDQIGSTWYDYQQNGSMGRMISVTVTSSGYRHFSWMYCSAPYPTDRYIDANSKNPFGNYVGQIHLDGGNTKAGFSHQTHLRDGTPVVVYHRIAGDPTWNTALAMDSALWSGSFNRHWDLPDYVVPPVGEPGRWPRVEVFYDSSGRDYLHIVMKSRSWGKASSVLGYLRCYPDAGDTLICQSYVNGATATYKIAEGDYASGPSFPISAFDSACSGDPVVATSPVSQRVAIAFLKPTCDGSCDYLSDVCFIESTNNGDDWIDGTNWPPPEHNITNFGCTGDERGIFDVSACYDYQDSLHIIYSTCGFDPSQPGYYQPGVARLYHWSQATGTIRISTAIWSGTDPGSYNLNIAKMSISAQDPIYHPGGDSVFLYCIWTQFDPGDNAANYNTNGDIYGCGSFDGVNTWGQPYNPTNTKTPGCGPGSCLSEHWSSMATNMYDGDLHIQYICDRDAGGAIMGEGAWLENPVMYLHLTDWPILPPCTIRPPQIEPYRRYDPPLKVTPNGSRTLVLRIFNGIGCPAMSFNVSSDHSCIQVSASGIIQPGDSAMVHIIVNGSDACADTFIEGNVILETNEGGGYTRFFPVQAVVANDHYECPFDPQTYDTLENGVLRLYTNANCEEWIDDIGTRPDTVYNVFFEVSNIIATTSGTDTLVGRFFSQHITSMDGHTGARDKLYTEQCEVEGEPDFDIVFTKNVFMHDLKPPANTKWFWWEMSKQIKFFKDTAPELYKHIVIEYVTVKRHDPPSWWPSQPPFTGYNDTYIGVVADIDAPWDTMRGESSRNLAGYDATNYIAWQKGWDYTGAHPEYNDYYCGIALANGGMPGESIVPYGSYNVLNHVHVYPNNGWGWKDGDLYRLSATAGNTIEAPDSALDRSYLFTARKIDAGNDPNASYSYTVVKVVALGGLSQLQEYVDSARALVDRERTKGYPIICGDGNGNGSVELGDVVYLISYLYQDGPPPPCPISRGDVSNNGGFPDLGDLVYLISYLYQGGPAPDCAGTW